MRPPDPFPSQCPVSLYPSSAPPALSLDQSGIIIYPTKVESNERDVISRRSLPVALVSKETLTSKVKHPSPRLDASSDPPDDPVNISLFPNLFSQFPLGLDHSGTLFNTTEFVPDQSSTVTAYLLSHLTSLGLALFWHIEYMQAILLTQVTELSSFQVSHCLLS